jgi:ribosomal protein S18 acetylase RimI-like enzyme
MKPVEDVAAVERGITAAKRTACGFITNCFIGRDRLAAWAARRELSELACGGCYFLLKREADFQRCYFYASRVQALEGALVELTRDVTGTLITDLVGKRADVERLAAVFGAAGFRPYADLVRMERPGGAPPGPESGVEYAGPDDVGVIGGMLEAAFDRQAEQLPGPEEVAAAVREGGVLVCRDGGRLAGLLHFEVAGYTATVRYWLVAPEARGQGVGARLMHAYFARTPGCRRHVLWVRQENQDAVRRYEHYGYRPADMVDRVMRRGDDACEPGAEDPAGDPAGV